MALLRLQLDTPGCRTAQAALSLLAWALLTVHALISVDCSRAQAHACGSLRSMDSTAISKTASKTCCSPILRHQAKVIQANSEAVLRMIGSLQFCMSCYDKSCGTGPVLHRSGCGLDSVKPPKQYENNATMIWTVVAWAYLVQCVGLSCAVDLRLVHRKTSHVPAVESMRWPAPVTSCQ